MLTVVILVFSLSVASSELILKGVPIVVTVQENSTILLPCYMEGSEQVTSVQWYQNSTAVVRGPRFKVHDNYTLQIDATSRKESGDYTCQIIRPDPWGNVSQTHSLVVIYPPSIVTDPADGYLEVNSGQVVEVTCAVDGSPEPAISWSKDGQSIPVLDQHQALRFRADHQSQAGRYECAAENAAGAAAAGVRLVINDAPEVTAVAESVHTSAGQYAQLTAAVVAGGAVRGHWFSDGRTVRYDTRVMEVVRDNNHSLVFRKVRESDFGNYTFRAENHLGMADVTIRLTGVPCVAHFNAAAHVTRPAPSSYTLVWEVDSTSTITEYNLWLRPHGTDADGSPRRWSKIVVPAELNDGPIHSGSYTVRGLTSSTSYEAIVASRNRYGWSKPSEVFHFATESAAVYRVSSTPSYSDTPVLEEVEVIDTSNDTAHARLELSESAGEQPTPSWTAILILAFWRAF